MKRIKICIIIAFIPLLSSCVPDVIYGSSYYKAFFLGEDDVKISGTVYTDYAYTQPANYTDIYARTLPNEVTGSWEATGKKGPNGNYEIVLKNTSNAGVTLSKDTVKDENKYLWGLNKGHIAFIKFYNDNKKYPEDLRGPYYKVKRPAGSYDYKYYTYIYVAEAINLSRTEKVEDHDVWGTERVITRYYDYNFDKVGWYKLFNDSEPLKNDPKHSSGMDTHLYIYY